GAGGRAAVADLDQSGLSGGPAGDPSPIGDCRRPCAIGTGRHQSAAAGAVVAADGAPACVESPLDPTGVGVVERADETLRPDMGVCARVMLVAVVACGAACTDPYDGAGPLQA